VWCGNILTSLDAYVGVAKVVSKDDQYVWLLRSRVQLSISICRELLCNQDVFIKAHSRLDTLAHADRVESWIYQIARNTIIDYYRTRKSTEPLPDEVPERPEQDDQEWQGLEKCVAPMIEMLPPGYRDALLLSEVDGLPLKEVAKRLNFSLPGAKSRVQRGREKLKKVFLDCCHFEFDCRGKPIDW
jgi:RNA polymerase sigma-70 factor (ECF subfamily)